jgi:hypothetical protein
VHVTGMTSTQISAIVELTSPPRRHRPPYAEPPGGGRPLPRKYTGQPTTLPPEGSWYAH